MISVILPVYRVEKYIDACIRSVLGQTYRDFEVILVDDGSPDRSATIAEDLLREDGRIPYQIIHTENRGVSAARNTGLANAQGEYVIMVDSDDVISPKFLQRYADMIGETPDLNIYSCGFRVVSEDNIGPFTQDLAEKHLLDRNEAQIAFFERKIRFLLPTLLLSRTFVQENGIRFDEGVRYSEDVQFIWRCLAYNRKSVLHSEEKLYNYILHSGSTMTASGIPKILTCCEGINRLVDQVGMEFCSVVQEQLIMRTHFSMLHGAAKMLDKGSFCQLYIRAQSKPHIKAQVKSGPIKVRVIAALLLLCKPLGYYIMKKF